MPSLATNESRRWAAARWIPGVVLVGLTLILIPPGSLPYAPGSTVSDAAITHWPAAHFLRRSVLVHRQWPLWTPLRMLGQPFAANPLNKVWYPPQWLVLLLPATLHLNVMIALHMGWGALGMAAWARNEKLEPLAAGFAALTWGFNAKLIAHLGAGHLDIVYALAWVPWALLAVSRMARQPSIKHTVIFGSTAALLALADLRIAFYSLPALALHAFTLRIDEHRQNANWRPFMRASALSLVLFLLLTAAQTLPLAAIGPYLTRTTLTPVEAAVHSLPPGYLLGMLIPDVGGFHEWMTYVPLPVLLLAAVALVLERGEIRTWAWLVLAALAAVWSLGDHTPLFPAMAGALPFVPWVRVPPRAWFVTVLALCVLASHGLDHLLKGNIPRRWKLGGAALIAVGAATAGAAVATRITLPGLFVFALTALGSGAGLWLAAHTPAGSQPDQSRIGGAILTGTAALSLIWLAPTLVEGRSIGVITADDLPLIAALGGTCDRVYSPSFELIGPAVAQAGIPTVHAVEPFQLRGSAEAIGEATGVPYSGYNVVVPSLPPDQAANYHTALVDAKPDPAYLAAMGIRWVVSRFAVDASNLALVDQVGSTRIYEVSGSPPAFVFPDSIEQPLTPDARTSHALCCRPPNRLLDASYDTLPIHERTVMVIPEAWAPGWKARIDGQPAPVLRVGGLFVGVELDPLGAHTVEIVYRPLADIVGAAISGLTAAALLSAAVLRRWSVR